jgi:hypothetical protein
MNSFNIPSAEDIMRQNGYVSFKDFVKNPVASSGDEDILRVAREKLERQRELKRKLDRIVQQVLG